MVFGLFRRSGRLNMAIQLEKPQGPYRFGETVRARIDLWVEGGPVKVREVEASLLYWQRYRQWKYLYSEEDEMGDEEEYWYEHWETRSRAFGRQRLLQGGTLPNGFRQRFTVAFSLPDQGEPPHKGEIAQAGWYFLVHADRPWGKDMQAQAEVPVVVPPPGLHTQPDFYGQASHPDVLEMSFHLPGLEFVEGDVVEGALLVRALQAVEGRGLRVALLAREFIPSNNPKTLLPTRETSPDFEAETKVGEVVRQGPLRLQPGETLRLPFRIEIPRLGRPTCTTGGNGWIRWFLTAALDRAWARDYRLTQELFVYNGR